MFNKNSRIIFLIGGILANLGHKRLQKISDKRLILISLEDT